MKSLKYLGFQRTKKGRVVYERKKHVFTWQRASRICFTLINDNIPEHLRDRYYARMRAGIIGYSYAMLRMYPGFARSYLLGFAKGGDTHNVQDEFSQQWKKTTFDIIDAGLTYIRRISPLTDGQNEVLSDFARAVAEKYYDWLFSL
jgi:hypothetical protein